MEKILILSQSHTTPSSVASRRTKSFEYELKRIGKVVEVVSGEGLSDAAWTYRTVRAIFQTDADYILLSMGPFWPMLLISLISYIRNKKLILDFRDPWSLNIAFRYGESQNFENSLKFKVTKCIEIICFMLAFRVWVCTPGMLGYYQSHFSSSSSKLKLVLNGFDNFKPNLNRDAKVCRYVCLGKFAEYSKEKAVRVLNLIDRTEDYHIQFIGSDVESNKQAVMESNLDFERVSFLPSMSYSEALKIVERSHVGLVVIRNESIDLGTKSFDYVSRGLRILTEFDHDGIYHRFFSNVLERPQFSYEKRFSRRYNSFKAFREILR